LETKQSLSPLDRWVIGGCVAIALALIAAAVASPTNADLFLSFLAGPAVLVGLYFVFAR
jgi:hypothetical protein